MCDRCYEKQCEKEEQGGLIISVNRRGDERDNESLDESEKEESEEESDSDADGLCNDSGSDDSEDSSSPRVTRTDPEYGINRYGEHIKGKYRGLSVLQRWL